MILPDEYAWEQLPNESAKAFQAFELYLRMGIERSLREVGAKLDKSFTLISRWSREHQWQERIRRYEKWKAQVRRDKLRATIEKSAQDDYETNEKIQSVLKLPATALAKRFVRHLEDGKDPETFFDMTNPHLLEAAIQASKVIGPLQSAKREALGVLTRLTEEPTEAETQELMQPPQIHISTKETSDEEH